MYLFSWSWNKFYPLFKQKKIVIGFAAISGHLSASWRMSFFMIQSVTMNHNQWPSMLLDWKIFQLSQIYHPP